MSDVFDDALAAITSEENTEAEVDALVEKARAQWAEIDKRYGALRGKQFNSESMKTIMALVRKYAPVALRTMGYGGAATAATSFLADDGAFGGILSKIGGIFGLG